MSQAWPCPEVCWPVKSMIGGLPALIRVKAFPILHEESLTCHDKADLWIQHHLVLQAFRLTRSSHSLVADVEGDERAKAIAL